MEFEPPGGFYYSHYKQFQKLKVMDNSRKKILNDLKKLALICRALGLSVKVVVSEVIDFGNGKIIYNGFARITRGVCIWDVWPDSGKYELHLIIGDETIYDTVYCDNMFELVQCLTIDDNEYNE